MSKKSTYKKDQTRVLEITSISELRHAQKKRDEVMGFYAQYYSSLAYQRTQILEELKASVRNSCNPFRFTTMFRLVRYRWTLEPLPSRGSITDPSGGRFNIGDLDESRFPKFPALYLASNAETAALEVFGKSSSKKKNALSGAESWLERMESCSFVRMAGELETVLDLTQVENLKPYFALIKAIKFPRYVKRLAQILRLQMPRTVKSTAELHKTLLDPDWRLFPAVLDVPANPQIFGHIVEASGTQGILYPSVKGNGKCLAVFPRNFADSGSYVEIADRVPEQGEIICKLDKESWKNLV